MDDHVHFLAGFYRKPMMLIGVFKYALMALISFYIIDMGLNPAVNALIGIADN